MVKTPRMNTDEAGSPKFEKRKDNTKLKRLVVSDDEMEDGSPPTCQPSATKPARKKRRMLTGAYWLSLPFMFLW